MIRRLREIGATGLVASSLLVACGGQVGVDAGGGAAGAPSEGSGGSQIDPGDPGDPDDPDKPPLGTGGIPYVEPECPDIEPPPVYSECDPLHPYDDCADGYGCYSYLQYPFGERCGQPQYGTLCGLAGEREHGELCGEFGSSCAPGLMCVVGAGGGRRCAQICIPGEGGCPSGLLCGETDVAGYGVCF